MEQNVGHYSFLVGVFLALILALFASAMSDYIYSIITFVLVVLGFIVGFLNITAKETTEFLVASVTLIVLSTAQLAVINNFVAGLGTLLEAILANIAVFVAPAAMIVSLKAIKTLAEKK